MLAEMFFGMPGAIELIILGLLCLLFTVVPVILIVILLINKNKDE